MKNLKKQFRQDFEKAYPKNLSFDVEQLPLNDKTVRHETRPAKKRAIVIACVSAAVLVSLGVIAYPYARAMFRIKESVQASKRSYSVAQIKIAESNTFRKLNDVVYPGQQSPSKAEISLEEASAYADFAHRTYRGLVDASNATNLSYSPIGLYSVVNEMTAAASRDDLKLRLNDLLGLNEEARVTFYRKVLGACSFATENATIQLKNSAFFNNEFDYNPAFVEQLTRLYCEAYQIDFDTEANKMIEWVDQAVNAHGFIDKKFLGINDQTQLFLFSTLYLKNAWKHKYLDSNTLKDDFHLASGATVQTDLMKHSYYADKYYDYGSYISIKDYYYQGVASVTYLVPKNVEDDIFALTKGSNIFLEKEGNAVRKDGPGSIYVNLSMPKFKTTGDINFRPCFEKLGFEDIFDDQYDSFHNAFTGEKVAGYPIYVQQMKQRNEVEFNEDGSIVRSLTMGGWGAGSAAPFTGDTLDVTLNQPFIYIIRDKNDVPIFVGHIDNPKA